MFKKKSLLTFALVTLAFTACKAPKDITYFQDMENGTTLMTSPVSEIVAQPDDRLTIVVHSQDPQLAEIFNMPIQARRIGVTTGRQSSALAYSNGGGGNNSTSCYTVDAFGDIEFPVLGTIHIGGMTRQQIAAYIKDELINRKLLKDPTISVEFLDHSFTALGSVNSPGRIVFDRDRLNIIEAIGLAGDLTIDGMRTNVKVLRMEEGKQKAYEVDLTDAQSLYKSPVFYVQQNDVIYVEPNDTKKRTTTANGNTPFTPAFWISIASFLSTIAVLILNTTN